MVLGSSKQHDHIYCESKKWPKWYY